MLPDVALPRIFDFYITDRSVAHADTRISRMVKYRFRVTSLEIQNTGKGDAVYLTTLSYRHRDEMCGRG